MSKHLNAGQISQWIAGERTVELFRHVQDCARCQTEVESFERVLHGFRDSLREWSAAEVSPFLAVRLPREREQSWSLRAGWVALSLLVILFVWLQSKPLRTNEISDAALLNQVHQEVSQSVPAPMQPLSGLISVSNND